MNDLPTRRQLLIALHAQGRPRRCERRGSPSWPPSADGQAAAAAETAAAASAAAAALGARIVTLLDPDYPPLLEATALPPPALVVRGQLPPGPAVAIVGSRLADAYGRQVASGFARYLAAAGVVIVSGLARGIDAAAHQGALAVPSGRTLAVLGCGMGIDYPRGHARLLAAIAGRGAVVSEFPCAAPPRRWRFPVRNRTIAGLAGVTLVVQATPRSGALVTARLASDLGRPVFAVPGPVFEPLSWGPHALLRRGAARLAEHPQDLLDLLATLATPATPDDAATAAAAAASPVSELDGAAETVLAAMRRRRGARAPAEIARGAGLPAEVALAALLTLEIAGRVERLHGMTYRLARTGAGRGRPPPPAGKAGDLASPEAARDGRRTANQARKHLVAGR
jgi:DNA processing protein